MYLTAFKSIHVFETSMIHVFPKLNEKAGWASEMLAKGRFQMPQTKILLIPRLRFVFPNYFDNNNN